MFAEDVAVPQALVTVTVFTPIVFTKITLVISPVFHKKLLALLLAVSVAVLPGHKAFDGGVTVTVGEGITSNV